MSRVFGERVALLAEEADSGLWKRIGRAEKIAGTGRDSQPLTTSIKSKSVSFYDTNKTSRFKNVPVGVCTHIKFLTLAPSNLESVTKNKQTKHAPRTRDIAAPPIMLLSSLLLFTPAVHSMTPVNPTFGWDMLANQSFFHRSNKTGPYTEEAIEIMARFPIVTIEKWQSIDSKNDTMEDNIVGTLQRVKEKNPKAVTIFYYNSVCDFPQYAELYPKFDAMPEGWLKDKDGKVIRQACAGFSNMPVFDFSQPAVRALWSSECANQTKKDGVDGCFVDRAVDGAPTGRLSPDKATEYSVGHAKVLTEVQNAVAGPIICNHAYGPPHDNTTVCRGAMIEGFSRNNASIAELLLCEQNKKICEAHFTGSIDQDQDTVAAYLIAAYGGDGFGSYMGWGGWNSVDEYDAKWAAEVWPDVLTKPLGPPKARAVLSADNVWSREFVSDKGTTKVTFDLNTNKGSIQWAE